MINGNTNSGNNKNLYQGDNRLYANSLLVFPPAYPLFFFGDNAMPKKGYHFSEKVRINMRKIMIERWQDPVYAKKMSDVHKGKKLSKESILKRTKSRIGYRHSEATKKKMSDARKKNPIKSTLGKHLSEATRRKIGESNKIATKKYFKEHPEARTNLSIINKGEKNHNWKGGISDGYKKCRAERDWKKIVKKVYKRDNYQCQLCGKNHKLHAHHIIPWRVSHNDKMSNLITLCIKCHSEIEKKWWQYAPMFFEILGIYNKSNEKSLFNKGD